MRVFLIILMILGFDPNSALAKESASVLYVPLIGLTAVPSPLALPLGPGSVTYAYAVKNFLRELSLTDIVVKSDVCDPVHFAEGDDNHDGRLDYDETWRYKCTTELGETTSSTTTATGTIGGITARHVAYATVVVGSDNPPPLVSIINVTKVAYPLALPRGGGKITFTYKVNNPGVVALSRVVVTDDKCSHMSGKLGDTNGNNLLDIAEVWIYTCTTNLTETTANTVKVSAFANGLEARGEATLTVKVDTPTLPSTGLNPPLKITVWAILATILSALIIFSRLSRKIKSRQRRKK